MEQTKRDEFARLFNEFAEAYLGTEAGRAHLGAYAPLRQAAARNLEGILAGSDRGDDITNAVLLGLLPHADTAPNREAGAWVHVASAIAGDLRRWYERSGWTKAEDWPRVAEAILALVLRCRGTPEELAAACAEFSDLPISKGFQTGMLSPILNALNPDAFALINNKSRRCANHWAGTAHGPRLSEYPLANETARRVVAELAPLMGGPAVPEGARPADLFDVFSHWLVAVKQYEFAEVQVRFWKIAPGDGAWNWEAFRDGAYIAMGWDKLGDLSGMSREQFVEHRDNLRADHEDLSDTGTDQAWRFYSEIQEGDRVVANRGTREVLGIGTVSGDYYFASGERYGHRLPVEWDDVVPRQVNESGWRRTLIELDRPKFEAIAAAPPVGLRSLAEPFSRIFRSREEAVRAFALLRETLTRLGFSGPQDIRYSLSLRSGTVPQVRLNHGWGMLIDFHGPASAEPRMRLALLDVLAGDLGAAEFSFKLPEDDRPISLYNLPLVTMWEPESPVRAAFLATLDHMRARFAHYRRSPYRRAHDEDVDVAVWDAARLDRLLTDGPGPKPDPDGYFAAETFALLEGLHAEPTRAFYHQHLEGFRTHLEEPFKELMPVLAAHLPEPAHSFLETEKRLTSRIPKNDFGRGGAWPHYWGAFYPKGSRRLSAAQLFVSINASGLEYGFHIAEAADQVRARFWNNVRKHADVLLAVWAGSLDEEALDLGAQDAPPASAADWLRRARGLPRVAATMAADAVLACPLDVLVDRITAVFGVLYPLVLLAHSDDPLPAILRYLGEDDSEPEMANAYLLEECAAATNFPIDTLRMWLDALARKKQAILYGPPGTGKTYMAEQLARHLIGGTDGFYEIVQFHPAYSYEDFVQGIRPQVDSDGHLTYPVVPGRLLRFCEEAAQRQGICVLIIDEINRAELSRVFGELMYLLEYRGEQVPLAVDGRLFAIPENVRIIGTMNTADRSIALVDHALRRRFAFIPLRPNYDVLAKWHERTGFPVDKLVSVLRDVNQEIGDPDYSVGITFFLQDDLEQHLGSIWQMEIMPYLEEYFFDRRSRVDRLRWENVRARMGLTGP